MVVFARQAPWKAWSRTGREQQDLHASSGGGRPVRGGPPLRLARLLFLVLYGATMFLLGAISSRSGKGSSTIDCSKVVDWKAEWMRPLLEQPADCCECTAGGAQQAGTPYTLEPFDVGLLLGRSGSVDGVMYAPYICLAPWSERLQTTATPSFLGSMKHAWTRYWLTEKMKGALRDALAGALRPLARNASAAAHLTSAPFMHVLGITSPADLRFPALNRLISNILARYLLFPDGSRYCACGTMADPGKPVTSVSEVGTSGCPADKAEPQDAGFTCSGSASGLLMREFGIDQLVEAVASQGICTSIPHDTTFAQWFIQERLLNPAFRLFPVKDPQEDTVLELFDLVYERDAVFLRQKWLGVTMMQQPFDLLAIQNIFYNVQPDMVIETGTANGGSALLWASLLEVLGLHESRIHTIDVVEPATGFGSAYGGGSSNVDPTEHPLWQKYVHFHKGFSTDPEVAEAVASAAATAKRVLVLLDSEHSAQNVAQELQLYCRQFVTVGSYCIVEDTRLSRMSRSPGPLEAVQAFLKDNAEWTADRERELMYSHHVMGYLKRTA